MKYQISVWLVRVVSIMALLSGSVNAAYGFDETDYELEPLLTDGTANLAISAELGALFTTGNTESKSILGRITSEYELLEWRHKYVFEFLSKEDQLTNAETGNSYTKTTAEKYLFNAEAYYNFSEKRSVFGFFGSDHDRFGAYTSYTTIAGGYNVRLIEGSLIVFDLNIAPGYTMVETSEGENEQGLSLRSAGNFEWIINSNAKFLQSFSIETSKINTRIISETALTAKIHGSMQMKVALRSTTNDSVAEGLAKTDSEMSVTLVVNF